VRNNVLYSAQSFRGAIAISADSLAGCSSDYNAVEDRFSNDGGDNGLSLAQWQAATGQDAHSFATDLSGLFVDLATDDYHPLDDGPLIDAGVVLVDVTEDLEGNPRPFGTAPDIGAFERAPLFWDDFESGTLDLWSRVRP
jgi:hypothetical protein